MNQKSKQCSIVLVSFRSKGNDDGIAVNYIKMCSFNTHTRVYHSV